MAVRILEFLADNTKGKPNEDFLVVRNSNIFAVGDGATRFVPAGEKYPDPSPAAMAASAFCRVGAGTLEHIRSTPASAELDIRRAFFKGNGAIKRVNSILGISGETTDYLEKDFAGCVGVLGVLLDETFHYGYIGDCGLMVFDSNLLPVFFTSNELAPLEQFRNVWNFESEEKRKLFWRKTMRNNPSAPHMTYGLLNGEEAACRYITTKSIKLKLGHTAVLFSDGALPYLFDSDLRGAIRDLRSDMKNFFEIAEPRLAAHGIKNLDDDKAFIAFQLTE